MHKKNICNENDNSPLPCLFGNILGFFPPRFHAIFHDHLPFPAGLIFNKIIYFCSNKKVNKKQSISKRAICDRPVMETEKKFKGLLN